MDEQQRFQEGSVVRVIDLSSPFYLWVGAVATVHLNSNGWPHYQIHFRAGARTQPELYLTFADYQLEIANG